MCMFQNCPSIILKGNESIGSKCTPSSHVVLRTDSDNSFFLRCMVAACNFVLVGNSHHTFCYQIFLHRL